MSSCLIAGCGYVGSALGERLKAAGHEVTGLRRRPEALPDAIRAVAADLLRPETLESLPESRWVFYTAAASGRDERAYREAYVEGLAHLLDSMSRWRVPPERVLFTSSTGVYHQTDGAWVDEESPTEPATFSGRILLEAESVLRASPFTSISVRFGGIYGPGRTRTIERVRSGEARLPAAGPVYSNRIHRDDCAGVLEHLAALAEPADCYVGVDHDPADLADVYRWLAELLGVGAPAQDPPSAASGPAQRPGGRAGSNKRCRNRRLVESGYTFRFPSFREGYRTLLGL